MLQSLFYLTIALHVSGIIIIGLCSWRWVTMITETCRELSDKLCSMCILLGLLY